MCHRGRPPRHRERLINSFRAIIAFTRPAPAARRLAAAAVAAAAAGPATAAAAAAAGRPARSRTRRRCRRRRSTRQSCAACGRCSTLVVGVVVGVGWWWRLASVFQRSVWSVSVLVTLCRREQPPSRSTNNSRRARPLLRPHPPACAAAVSNPCLPPLFLRRMCMGPCPPCRLHHHYCVRAPIALTLALLLARELVDLVDVGRPLDALLRLFALGHELERDGVGHGRRHGHGPRRRASAGLRHGLLCSGRLLLNCYWCAAVCASAAPGKQAARSVQSSAQCAEAKAARRPPLARCVAPQKNASAALARGAGLSHSPVHPSSY